MQYSTIVALATLAASLSSAQSLPSIPNCAANCFITALSSDGCASLTDFACACSKPSLAGTILPCVAQACPNVTDQQSVSQTIVDTCYNAGVPVTISGVTTTDIASATPAPSARSFNA